MQEGGLSCGITPSVVCAIIGGEGRVICRNNSDTLISAPSPEPAAGVVARAGKEVSF